MIVCVLCWEVTGASRMMAGRSFGIVRACSISADCGPGPRYSAKSDSIADCIRRRWERQV